MNWYSKIQIKNFISLNKTSNKNSKIKTASLDWKNQEDDRIELGNFQRYVCDSQTVKVFLTKTSQKWAVSLITNHTYLGTLGWSIFWEFNLDEKEHAKEIFKKASQIAKDVVEQFIREEQPTVNLHAALRQRFKEIEREDVTRTNIPAINYSYDIPYEVDWRETIYGKRYPKYKEESFKQYLNNSIYSGENAPTGKFAL